MKRPASIVLRSVVACPVGHRCACVARGVATVHGFGRATCALYDDARGLRATAGNSSGGPKGSLRPADFEAEPLQTQILATFIAQLSRSRGEAAKHGA